jgi:tetratricopeptide (TPR) repeat protein
VENSQNSPSAGIECAYGPGAVRLGANFEGFAAGLGARFGDFTVDYAMAMNVLGPINTLSVGVKFGKTRQEYEEDIKRISAGQILTPKEARKLARHHYQEGVKHMAANEIALAIIEFDTAQLLYPQNIAIRRDLIEAKAKLDASVDTALVARYRDSAMKMYLDLDMQGSLVEWQKLLLVDTSSELAKDYIAKITVRLSAADVKSAVTKMDVVKQAEIKRLLDEAERLYADKIYQKAIALWRKVLKIEPANEIAKEKLADVQDELNDQVSAAIEKARKFIAAKNINDAAVALRFANEISPDDATVMSLLVRVTAEITKKQRREQRKKNDKRYYEAVSFYMQADPSIHPNPHYKKAFDICQDILKTDPLFDAAKDLMARIDAREGRREIHIRRPDDE